MLVVVLVAVAFVRFVLREQTHPFPDAVPIDVGLGLKADERYRVLQAFGLDNPFARGSRSSTQGDIVVYQGYSYGAHDGVRVFSFHRASGELTTLLVFDSQPPTDVWLFVERSSPWRYRGVPPTRSRMA